MPGQLAELLLDLPRRVKQRSGLLEDGTPRVLQLPLRLQKEHRVGQEPAADVGTGAGQSHGQLLHLTSRQSLAGNRFAQPLTRPRFHAGQGGHRPGRRPGVDLAPPDPLLDRLGHLRNQQEPLADPALAPSHPQGQFRLAPPLPLLERRQQPPLLQPAEPFLAPELLDERQGLASPEAPHGRFHRVLPQALQGSNPPEAVDDHPSFSLGHDDDRHLLTVLAHGGQHPRFSPSLSGPQPLVPKIQLSQLQLHRVLRLNTNRISPLTPFAPARRVTSVPALSTAARSLSGQTFLARCVTFRVRGQIPSHFSAPQPAQLADLPLQPGA